MRGSGAIGHSGRLLDLFDFLAARGPAGEPATQAEISETVFGQPQTEVDDATARVYIHRLRKRLEQFYESRDAAAPRLVIPAGAYALRFEQGETPAVAPPRAPWRLRPRPALLALLVALGLGLAFLAGRDDDAPEVNAIWRPFVESDRPLVIAMGDYYIYGQHAPDRFEIDRMVRDFSINSKIDLARAQESEPSKYGDSEDMGLSYLPMSSAYALRALMPVLASKDKSVRVMPASQMDSDVFRTSNVIYVGLISGMGMLQDVAFTDSTYAVGESYDELVDMVSGRRFVSGESFALPTANYYQDYGYVARFRQPGGALIGVVAGERDTGLRGVAPVAVGRLTTGLEREARKGSFEALYQITGQQGADLAEKLIQVRQRP